MVPASRVAFGSCKASRRRGGHERRANIIDGDVRTHCDGEAVVGRRRWGAEMPTTVAASPELLGDATNRGQYAIFL